MDNKTLVAVIVTALIVAVLTSLITVKLTGNAIFGIKTTTQGFDPLRDYYTKTQVDALLKSLHANPEGVNLKSLKIEDNFKDFFSKARYGSESLDFSHKLTREGSTKYGAQVTLNLDRLQNYQWNLWGGGGTQFRLMWDELFLGRSSTVVNDFIGPYDKIAKLSPDGLSFTWNEDGKTYSSTCKPDKNGVFKCGISTAGTTNSPPSVSILSPKNGEIIKCIGKSTCLVNITTTAQDNSGIRFLDFDVDGKYNKRGVMGDSFIIIPNFDCNTKSGIHIVKAKVVANDDEVAESAQITFTVTGCPA
ncbi:MAG: hypothetical protein AABW75_02195 [Nanoarchaeota archaeon]